MLHCMFWYDEHVKEQGSKSLYYIEETLENNVQENLPILKLTGQMTSNVSAKKRELKKAKIAIELIFQVGKYLSTGLE